MLVTRSITETEKGGSLAAASIELDHRNRGVFSRCLYRTANRDFMKIWYEDFVYRLPFTTACKRGFYGRQTDGLTLSTLKALLVGESNVVLGYVTREAKRVAYGTVDKAKLSHLVKRMVDTCLRLELVYIDFVIDNIVEENGVYHIVDLEAVLPAEFLKTYEQSGIDVRSAITFCNLEYRMGIASLLGDYDNP